MRNYEGMRLPPGLDAYTRNELLKVDKFLRQLGPALRFALEQGNNPRAVVEGGPGGGGSGGSGLGDHNHSQSGEGGNIIGTPYSAIDLYGLFRLYGTTPPAGEAIFEINAQGNSDRMLRLTRLSSSHIQSLFEVYDELNELDAAIEFDAFGYCNFKAGGTNRPGAFGITDGFGNTGYFYIPSLAADRLYAFPDADGDVVITDAIQTLNSKTLATTNILQCNTAAIGARFEDTTTNTKRLRMITSGCNANTNTALSFTSTASRTFTFPNCTANVLAAEGTTATSGTAIGATNLLAAGHAAGVYRIEVVALTTVASGAGAPTLDVTIGWTDDVGATTQNAVTGLSLAATGRASGSVLLRSTGAAAVTYATTVNAAAGSPTYILYIRTIHEG